MKASNKEIFAIFWRHIKPYGFVTGVLFLIITVYSLLEVATPWYYKRFFDTLTMEGVAREDLLPALLGIVVWIAFLRGSVWFLRRLFDYLNIYQQSHVMRNLARTGFSHVVDHSQKFFANTFVGSLVRKVRRLPRAFEVIADSTVFDFWPVSIVMVGSLVIVYSRSVEVFCILLGWLIFFLIGNLWFARFKQKYDEARAAMDSKVTGVLADAISNHTTVQVFTGEDYEREAFDAATEELRVRTRTSWNIGVTGDAVFWGLLVLAEVLMLWIAARLWAEGSITVGDIALFQGYFVSFVSHVRSLGRSIRRTYEGLADAKEMVEVLKTKHDVVNKRGSKDLPVKRGAIRFKSVEFGYRRGRKILNKLSFSIKAKERVALVGPSGAGKSTIVKLIMRFADIQRGEILIDGTPIKKYTLKSLRGHISYVPQESVLFHRTIMENIRYGRPSATDEEVIEAAKRARCHTFVSELAKGYQTFVGERGVKLSGGERQRVAIARAILSDAPVLILDEATSSLDSESELLIQEALEELMKDRTTIVIAHRLSTIMQMDRILVIEGGKLKDHGTHKQLSKKKGIYKDLWDIQVGGFLP